VLLLVGYDGGADGGRGELVALEADGGVAGCDGKGLGKLEGGAADHWGCVSGNFFVWGSDGSG
jgi:hypothetical protein